MSEAQFIERLRALSRDCVRLEGRPGDPGPVPATKLGGEPWWPQGTPRPHCRKASHRMAFIAQVRLADVPGLEHLASHLYSFHYCQQCALLGNMSFGWSERDDSPQPVPYPTLGQRVVSRLGIAPLPTCPAVQDSFGYDTSIFTSVDRLGPDSLGVVAESPVSPLELSRVRVPEVPTAEDYPEDLDDPRDPLDFLEEETGEFEIADLVHVYGSKLGGWPSWAQNRQYPPGVDGAPMQFIAQLDHRIASDLAWGGGGYAYLFADLSSSAAPCAQLVIQTT